MSVIAPTKPAKTVKPTVTGTVLRIVRGFGDTLAFDVNVDGRTVRVKTIGDPLIAAIIDSRKAIVGIAKDAEIEYRQQVFFRTKTTRSACFTHSCIPSVVNSRWDAEVGAHPVPEVGDTVTYRGEIVETKYGTQFGRATFVSYSPCENTVAAVKAKWDRHIAGLAAERKAQEERSAALHAAQVKYLADYAAKNPTVDIIHFDPGAGYHTFVGVTEAGRKACPGRVHDDYAGICVPEGLVVRSASGWPGLHG